MACSLEHPACLDGAYQDLSNYLSDVNYFIHPDIRQAAYDHGIKGSTDQDVSKGCCPDLFGGNMIKTIYYIVLRKTMKNCVDPMRVLNIFVSKT